MTDAAKGWEIGFAKRLITPPLGSLMAGFDARKEGSNAVHDDLHARALVFIAGGVRAAFVSVELLALSAEFCSVVRLRIEQATGIPASHIFLAATHTHCGPITIHQFFDPDLPIDEEYLEYLADGIAVAVEEAFATKRPRRLKSGTVEVTGIAVNRRSPDGLPIDPQAGLLLVEESDGTPAAIAVFYACHTTVLGPNTRSTSQDFPFYTLEKLRSALGEGVEAFFFNGAEGDLSVGHKSELSAIGVVDSFRTFATAQRLGERLADAVLVGLSSAVEEAPLLEVVEARVGLPLKTYDPLAEMTKRKQDALSRIASETPGAGLVAARQQYLFARIEEYYAKLYEEAPAAAPKDLDLECAVIRLGETVFVTLPGEVFVKIALAIREASPFPRTHFLGLTNNYIAYVPDQGANSTTGYEVAASRVTAEGGIVLEQTAARLLGELAAVTE